MNNRNLDYYDAQCADPEEIEQEESATPYVDPRSFKKMPKGQFNKMYQDYKASPSAEGLDDLLAEVLLRARKELAFSMVADPEDFAQRCVVNVWNELTNPDREITNFCGFVTRKIKWVTIDGLRIDEKTRELAGQAKPSINDDGEIESEGDTLDRIAYQYRTHDHSPDPSTLSDPFTREVAEMLLLGKTQAEVAKHLGMTVQSMRRKLAKAVKNN